MTIGDLNELHFTGPYPHGEYYLYDDNCALENGFRCIMCVYPPSEEQNWTASYNNQRGTWCDDTDKYFDSGWIEFATRKELDELLVKSRALT